MSKQLPLVEEGKLKEEIEEREEELAKGGFALEDELEREIVQNVGLIERGLVLKSRQYKTDAGIVDLLAEDSMGNVVVIELKAGDAEEKALVQLLRYMAAIKKYTLNREVRGIIVAHSFSDETRLAASMIPNIKLKTYRIRIEISDV